MVESEAEDPFEALIEKVRAPRIGEIIAENLRKLIIRGELPEGYRLPSEARLSRLIGISTPTLREALRILEVDSLIKIRRGPGGGPIVCVPSPDVAAKHFGLVLQSQGATLLDVFRIRQLIEPPALRIVISQARSVAPALLGDLVQQEWDAFQKQDTTLLSHYYTRFHDQLVQLTGNQTLFIMMHMLNAVYEKHVKAEYLIGGTDAGKMRATELSIKAHEKLVEMIARGDADAAVEYWVAHLARVRTSLFKYHDSLKVIDVLD